MTILLRSLRSLEFTVLILSLVMVRLYVLEWRLAESLCLGIVASGFLFPGIAHGAVDNHLFLKPLDSLPRRMVFFASYVGLMVAVLILWLMLPSISAGIFIIISSLHFGETDSRRYGIDGMWQSFLIGLSLLLFILVSHLTESESYLRRMGVMLPVWQDHLSIYFASGTFVVLSVILLTYSRRRIIPLILFLIVLATTTFLPLIVAFGLYFVYIHSFSAWNSIRTGLKCSHFALMRMAAPYTILAVALMLMFLGMLSGTSVDLEQHVAWVFIFISCISTPHILLMHLFYRANKDG
jgi:Brp/Blh family beta-carotene 15,15'-monooxygenase